MKNKKLTIQDIADLAGVAKSTVSRYLNGGRISPETSEKIKNIIQEYNYEPNAFAQSLKAKRSNFIGIIAPCLDSVVTSCVIMSIDNVLKSQGYNSLILNTSLKSEAEVEYIDQLARLKVDGIILIATELTEKHKETIKKLSMPIIIVGQEYEEIVSLINNDYEAGYTVGTYLINKGHKNVLYLGVSEEDVAVGVVRKQGVIDSLLVHDIKVMEAITDFSTERSEQVMDELVKNLDITAIICATDKIALGALRAIQKSGKQSPENISLIGFGGYDIANTMTPKLTTIKFHNEEMGERCAHAIIDLIEEKEVERLQVVGFELIEGDSVIYK